MINLDTNEVRRKLAILDGHTEGPWTVGHDLTIYAGEQPIAVIVSANYRGHQEKDANFIASGPNVRDTLLATLDEVDRLRAVLNRIVESSNPYTTGDGHAYCAELAQEAIFRDK